MRHAPPAAVEILLMGALLSCAHQPVPVDVGDLRPAIEREISSLSRNQLALVSRPDLTTDGRLSIEMTYQGNQTCAAEDSACLEAAYDAIPYRRRRYGTDLDVALLERMHDILDQLRTSQRPTRVDLSVKLSHCVTLLRSSSAKNQVDPRSLLNCKSSWTPAAIRGQQFANLDFPAGRFHREGDLRSHVTSKIERFLTENFQARVIPATLPGSDALARFDIERSSTPIVVSKSHDERLVLWVYFPPRCPTTDWTALVVLTGAYTDRRGKPRDDAWTPLEAADAAEVQDFLNALKQKILQ